MLSRKMIKVNDSNNFESKSYMPAVICKKKMKEIIYVNTAPNMGQNDNVEFTIRN